MIFPKLGEKVNVGIAGEELQVGVITRIFKVAGIDAIEVAVCHRKEPGMLFIDFYRHGETWRMSDMIVEMIDNQ